jgi:hypothetical protein
VKRNIMIMLVVLLLFALAVPVFAARVEKETESFEFVDTLVGDCSVYGDGWDFAVLDDVAFTRNTTYKYNNDDVLVRRTIHSKGTDTVYRENFPDDAVTSSWHNNIIFDLITGEAAAHGNQWNIHLPGVGSVFHYVGSEFWADWDEGIFDRFVGLDYSDYEKLCRYFAD